MRRGMGWTIARGTATAMSVAALAMGAAAQGEEIREEATGPHLEEERRGALEAHPTLAEHPILFVTRKQYQSDHHNTATLFQNGEVNTFKFAGGSALKVLDVAKGEVVTLLESATGVIRDPEVSFDGKQIVFSMRQEIDDDYHVWEIGSDGSGRRQLTSAPMVSDIDPLYLPDGGIMFSSTREPKFCMCNQHIMANLFRMERDGTNARQIGKSTLFEGHPALLADGRVLYDRWEYVDRNFGDAQGLWTVNPDGTNPAVYWGNNTNSPGGVIDARPIPGTERVLCIFGSCHDRPWGALAIIDRRLGLDGRDGVVRTWPPAAIERVGKGNWDAFLSVRPRYEDPWPLDANTFLASRETGEGEEMALVLVDTNGGEFVLHREAPGCYDPMPLAPRTRPGAITARHDLTAQTGRMYVADVYEGTHLEGIERGSVKSLRVIESPEKRFFTNPSWGGQGVHKPAMNWHDFNNKRILGTVPVEEDGSAYFELPADTFVYFQLLDEEGMMVQSMRSGTMVRPGETTGCIGCHDDRRSAPPTRLSRMPLAVGREPSVLEGWYGPPREFDYVAEVQPVFDRSCVSCHDYGAEAVDAINLAADRTLTFNTSYNELWRRGFTGAIGAGPAATQPARSWGSHASRLVEVVREDHYGSTLEGEDLDRVVTWIDLNAPYYPTYASAYPENLAGRSPLDNEQIAKLTELTGVPFAQLASFNGNRGPQISFDRPELSPCLQSLPEEFLGNRTSARELIERGMMTLMLTPRADMEGFVPCAEDRRREQVYTAWRAAEAESRRAIGEAREVTDDEGSKEGGANDAGN